ncbi:MAG: ABC-F family ATP-binding cassette domain-containing protein [Victivallaceae bacterium]|nr:ABC-F family ATP-binding cassette domain-containing protein [Victivallaceae bacterium]
MIDFQGVSKSYGGRDILKDVSFRINDGERVGIVGPNGAGKSTIFGIVTGIVRPDAGAVAIPRDHRIGIMRQKIDVSELPRTLLDFTADAIPELKLYENELHGIEEKLESVSEDAELDRMLRRHGHLQSTIEHLGAYHLEQEAAETLGNLGFDPKSFARPMHEFSGGWQMRAALARVLISHPDVLLLDEPSNYLDVPAVEWLCRYLNTFPGTLALISHDRFLLRKLVRTTLEVNRGAVTRYAGGYDYYCRERDSRRKLLESAKRNLDRRRGQMERVIERFRAKSTKAAQAKSWMKKLDKLEDVDLPESLDYNGVIRFPQPPPGGTEAARIENLSFGYSPDKILLRDVSLDIAAGDKIAFIGYNGLGKTTLLKLLVGKLQPLSGRVVLGHHSVIGYQAQEFTELLNDELSVYDAVRGALPPAASTANLMNVLGSFGFSGEETEKRCGVLSGGERIRVQFARIFVNPPNFLILDEPTTHLDLEARELLQEALVRFPGTVCFVSHDIEFVRAVATTIVALTPGKTTKYFGNYDYYAEKSAAAQRENTPENPARPAGGAVADEMTARERRQQRAHARQEISGALKKARAEVDALEKNMETLADRRKVLVAKLSSGMKLNFAALKKELAQIEAQLTDAENRWEIAATELEALRQENDRINQKAVR